MLPKTNEINEQLPIYKKLLQTIEDWRTRDPGNEWLYISARKAVHEAWKSIYRLGIRSQLFDQSKAHQSEPVAPVWPRLKSCDNCKGNGCEQPSCSDGAEIDDEPPCDVCGELADYHFFLIEGSNKIYCVSCATKEEPNLALERSLRTFLEHFGDVHLAIDKEYSDSPKEVPIKLALLDFQCDAQSWLTARKTGG